MDTCEAIELTIYGRGDTKSQPSSFEYVKQVLTMLFKRRTFAKILDQWDPLSQRRWMMMRNHAPIVDRVNCHCVFPIRYFDVLLHDCHCPFSFLLQK